jgi:hypothetical protein
MAAKTCLACSLLAPRGSHALKAFRLAVSCKVWEALVMDSSAIVLDVAE